jgi:hypothetical protein
MQMLTSDTTLDRPDAPQLGGLDPEPGAHTAHMFTDEQARAYLDQCVKRPSVRALAEAWCWSKSSVGRFLSRLNGEMKPGTNPPVPPSQERPLAQAGVTESEIDESLRMFAPESTDLLIHEQPATAVYVNVFDQVVIRQEARDDSSDQIVRFEPQHIPKLIARLQELVRAG